MKYNLMIRSRPTEDIFQRHDRFHALLSGLRNEWGLIEGAEIPKVRNPGTRPMREVNLSNCFQKGIKALVSYQNRKYLRDEAEFDDYFTMDFDPSRFDYSLLCEFIFLKYLESFVTYVGEIGDEELGFLGITPKCSRKIECRNAVYRIYPVCFFDRELCDRAFHLTPGEIARRVDAIVEKSFILSNGVWIIANSKVVTIEEANAINKEAEEATGKGDGRSGNGATPWRRSHRLNRRPHPRPPPGRRHSTGSPSTSMSGSSRRGRWKTPAGSSSSTATWWTRWPRTRGTASPRRRLIRPRGRLPAGWLAEGGAGADPRVRRAGAGHRDHPGHQCRLPEPDPRAADVAMLVEVSDWTLGQDRGMKLVAYARDGIAVYWIVNLVDRQVEVYTRPVKAGRYRSRKDYKPGQQIPVVIAGQQLPPIAVNDILP